MKRKISQTAAISSILLSLFGCANDALEKRLAPDPQLQASPVATIPSSPAVTPTLPVSFPLSIPVYPDAELTQVENEGEVSYWQTNNSAEQVKQYYQEQLKFNGWQIAQSNLNPNQLRGDRPDLQLTISFLPPETNSSKTAFTLTYQTQASPTATPKPITATPPTNNSSKVPAELRPYLEDLVTLGTILAQGKSASNLGFNPNAPISRRQYARWLFTANNQILANNPSLQIRLAATDIQPAFTDVPKTDPDFPIIQGLAEAGIIPSSLSGDTTATLFRPNAPLTREILLLWKVPLDTRQALPKASIAAIQETWGFQDAAKIAPEATKAVLADFQNGEKANIKRAFGFTTLFQPKKAVTHAEAAATIWYFGAQGEGRSAKEALEIPKTPPSPLTTPTPAISPIPSPTS